MHSESTRQNQQNSQNSIPKESRLRTLVKSLIYRILSLVGTGTLTWLITKDTQKTISIVIALQIFLMILYYSYERVWNRIDWGRDGV
ncbi:MAG: DUF2061 domain-containing protein [Candidatus Omnitrophica bacterium]|nr:DUF2061 domain-containing protein [Candidatus Omnitrophota bacterium]